VRRSFLGLLLLVVPLVAAACSGGSGSSQPTIAIHSAKTWHLGGFEPPAGIHARRPTTLAFTIDQPSGQPLTKYKTGPGPHTGIHLIIVRDDLSAIIHRHPKPAADGQVKETVDFPRDGRYRVLVDVYPRAVAGVRNFQLHRDVTVGTGNPTSAVPPFRATQVVDGYRVSIHKLPKLRALQPSFFQVTVTDSQGRPAHFTPWYGALAHAIFFRKGSLDYFHTHVCGNNTPGCISVLGNPKLASNATTTGHLNIGVLLPVAGTWRLFLQFKPGAHVITAPFTLHVR
jgi:hypothetical protein